MLPGNSSAELFPAAPPRRVLSDTSLSLGKSVGKSVGKSHVLSTSPLSLPPV